MDVWKIIFFSIKIKHPEWSNKKITARKRHTRKAAVC